MSNIKIPISSLALVLLCFSVKNALSAEQEINREQLRFSAQMVVVQAKYMKGFCQAKLNATATGSSSIDSTTIDSTAIDYDTTIAHLDALVGGTQDLDKRKNFAKEKAYITNAYDQLFASVNDRAAIKEMCTGYFNSIGALTEQQLWQQVESSYNQTHASQ